MSAPVIVRYQARSGVRYVAIWDAGDSGYSTRSASPGCHTYQSRCGEGWGLVDVYRYAIDHAPGVRTYATRAACVRALVRDYGVDRDDVRDVDRVPTRADVVVAS